MTYREYVQKNYPHKLYEDMPGGISGCPACYVRSAPAIGSIYCIKEWNREWNRNSYKEWCPKCFNKEIPHDAVDARTGKRVYPYEFIEEES